LAPRLGLVIDAFENVTRGLVSDTELFCHYLNRFADRKPGRQPRFGRGKSKRLDEIARRGSGAGFKISITTVVRVWPAG
jgi:hypothetical protein